MHTHTHTHTHTTSKSLNESTSRLVDQKPETSGKR